jgi:hypothetical protein
MHERARTDDAACGADHGRQQCFERCARSECRSRLTADDGEPCFACAPSHPERTGDERGAKRDHHREAGEERDHRRQCIDAQRSEPDGRLEGARDAARAPERVVATDARKARRELPRAIGRHRSRLDRELERVRHLASAGGACYPVERAAVDEQEARSRRRVRVRVPDPHRKVDPVGVVEILVELPVHRTDAEARPVEKLQAVAGLNAGEASGAIRDPDAAAVPCEAQHVRRRTVTGHRDDLERVPAHDHAPTDCGKRRRRHHGPAGVRECPPETQRRGAARCFVVHRKRARLDRQPSAKRGEIGELRLQRLTARARAKERRRCGREPDEK